MEGKKHVAHLKGLLLEGGCLFSLRRCWWTNQDDVHQPIAKDHLSDTGDQQTWYMEIYMFIASIVSLMYLSS